MFATLAGVSLFAQTVVPFGALAATYSQELQDAYNWAYSKSITTMSPIDNANMYGAITRAELAKMLANWAKDRGETPDTSAACNFTDTASVKGDLATAIVESCQLGLMGQGITAFRPYDTISRAEFGTALSRALWGSQYEGGTPYYAKHLDALKAAGIMTQIANAESTKEVRGYVMLMLMRSEWETPSACEETDVKVICALEEADGEYKDCPVACRANESEETPSVVKAGDLAVKAVKNDGSSVISNGATSELDTLTFKASEDITVKSVTLERYGYSNYDSIATIWLEDLDGNKVTSEKSLSPSKDQVTLSLKKDYQTIGKDASLIVVVATPDAPAANLGTSIGFKVKDVDSSAKNLDLSNYSANLYDIIDYNGSDVTIAFKGTPKTYSYEEWKAYQVAKIKVSAANAAILVNGFTLSQSEAWTLDLAKFVDEVEVLVDGKAIDSKASLKRDELKVSFADQEIAINKNSTFTVNVTLKDYDEFGSIVNLGFESSTDLSAMEVKNKVRVSNNVPEAGLYDEATYTFNGWKINLSNGNLKSSIDAAAWSDDVLVAKGSIALGGQAVRLSTLTVTPTTEWSEVQNAQYVEAVKLIIWDEEYEATEANGWLMRDIVIEDDADVEVRVDIIDLLAADEEAASKLTISFAVNDWANIFNKSTLNNIKYEDVSNTIAGQAVDNLIGQISISSVKVQPSKGSLTNDSNKKVEFKVEKTTEKLVFNGTYAAKDSNIHLNNVKIANTSTGDVPEDSDIAFTVKINGKAVATIANPDETWEDQDFSEIVVKAGETAKVEVYANVYAAAPTQTTEGQGDAAVVKPYNLTYELTLKWVDDQDNEAWTKTKPMAPMSFVDSSSVTVSTNAAMKQQDVVLAGTEKSMARFIVKPANKASTADLDTLVFDLEWFDAYQFSADKDAEDYFDVLIGGVSVDGLEFASATTLEVTDLDKEISGETEVEVVFTSDLHQSPLAGTALTPYVITLSTINDNSSLGDAYVYTRVAVNALVRVATMAGNKESETKYTFDIEYSDNANTETIPELYFTYTHDIEWADDSGDTVKKWTNLQEGKSYSVDNIADTVNYVTDIHYVDGDGNNVYLDYGHYEDFFKVGNDEARLRAYPAD